MLQQYFITNNVFSLKIQNFPPADVFPYTVLQYTINFIFSVVL